MTKNDKPIAPVRTARHLYLQATITAVFGEEPWWYFEEDAESMHPYVYAAEVGMVPVTFTRQCTDCKRHMWPVGKLTSEFVRSIDRDAAVLTAAEWYDGMCAECVARLYLAARVTATHTWRLWRTGGEA